MKASRSIYIPVILTALIALALLLYSLTVKEEHPRPPQFSSSTGQTGQAAGNVQHPPKPEGGDKGDIFKTLGTIAVVVGAFNYSWFRLKKKLTSPSPLIKRVSKWVYKLHNLSGWCAVLLIVVHGTYLLITKFGDRNMFSGLAAFVILAVLVVYGLLTSKTKSKATKRTHLLLGALWLPALLIHAGGSFIATAIVTVFVLWAGVPLLERWTGAAAGKRRSA